MSTSILLSPLLGLIILLIFASTHSTLWVCVCVRVYGFIFFYCELIFSVCSERLRISTRGEVHYNSEVFGCSTYWSLSNRNHTGKESAETGLRVGINRRSLGQGDWLLAGYSSKFLRLFYRIHNQGIGIWTGQNDNSVAKQGSNTFREIWQYAAAPLPATVSSGPSIN